MLSNILSKIITILLVTALAVAPVLGFAKDYPLNKGEFPDGAVVLYQCESKSSVKFMLTTPEGMVYPGPLFCGDTV
jgi:hypothetical protein